MITLLHTEPNEAEITELYAFLSTDETGEGICAVGGMTLVTSKARVAEMMRPLARDLAQMSGKPVRLVRFTKREEVP